MRSWLTYIFLLMVACGTVLTSCSDVLSEEGLGTCDDRTTVQLTLSLSGSGPMSRDVSADTDGTIPNLDYTTTEQCAMDVDDIYILAFKKEPTDSYTLLDWVANLELVPSATKYYEYTIKGRMRPYDATVKFVVLANLHQNNISALNNGMDAFLTANKGKSPEDIYAQLIYNYDANDTNKGGKWVIDNRRIPMWGETNDATLSSTYNQFINMSGIPLYRAVAKVQIWVGMKNGLAGPDEKFNTDDDFIINQIIVNNANEQGYCVSQKELDTNPNIQYTTPDIPNDVTKQSAGISYVPKNENVSYQIDGQQNRVQYNDAKQCYADFIYLPEQVNSDGNEVTITVKYTYGLDENNNPKQGEGTIKFIDNNGYYNVVRNHSYIFNIRGVSDAEEVEPTLFYQVINWTTINNGELIFGNGSGNVNTIE